MRAVLRCLLAVTCLAALLLSHGNGVAEPSRFLKGVTIIGYWIAVEKTVFGEGCKIDQSSLATALQFVANQSTRLKVIPMKELDRRANELLDARDQIFKELSQSGKVEDMTRAMGSDRYVAKDKAIKELLFPPRLSFDIVPLEVSDGCVGRVEVEVSAYFDNTKMRHTGTTMYEPHIPIWAEIHFVVGPQRTFTDQVTKVAEELMKALVNDWTASQDLPE